MDNGGLPLKIVKTIKMKTGISRRDADGGWALWWNRDNENVAWSG